MNVIEKLRSQQALYDFHLFDVAGTTITVATIVIFILILLVTFVASLVLQRALVKGFRLRGVTDEGTLGVGRKLLHYVIMAVGFGVGLQTIGINLSALFAAGAIFAVGIGFAMRNIAENFVSGLILLLERTIKPGDVLRIEGQFVKVMKMGIRATIARTLDDEEIIVPNATMVQSTVTNYTLRDSVYRLRAVVGVSYGSDLAVVRRCLEEVAAAVPWKYQGKEPIVLLSEFGSSSVNYEVSVWMEDPWRVRRAASEVNEAIWWEFKKAEITIAFPQVDVHLDAPVVASLQALGAAS